MSNYPLASCITPTFGRSHLLPELYYFWVNQTYPNKELIILNDEKNLILKSDDPRVKIFNFDERFVGLGAKRNFLVDNVSKDSKYILPFDDDDIFLPQHIESLVDAFKHAPAYCARTKNSHNFIIKDNVFNGVMKGTWPFFGASCFSTKILKQYKFEDNYMMGEDTKIIDDNKLITHYSTLKYPTFGYRQGMNIVHASGHRIKSEDLQQQKKIYDKIGNSVSFNNEPKELLLHAKLSYQSEITYRELINRQKWFSPES